MNARAKKIIRVVDRLLFSWIVWLVYPKYHRPIYSYQLNIKILLRYGILQKIVGFNRSVPWPVHFTSTVVGHEKIEKEYMCDPGDTPGCYIQAYNGIKIGSNVEFGAGVKIISANHAEEDYSRHVHDSPVQIGSNVWIGANSVILPGICIGDNVIIGAGSVVSKNIPADTVAAGIPCRPLRAKLPYAIETKKIKLNRKFIS
ncbi:acyltransferase [Variovorax terrae]|uniref:Acetyltransferase n=1 Tax=Variovorax terrae TaxID=2923278 RepID=A0A9X2AQ95_9BURK|nr:DapH/DapD/GlmU-related protein [Variovorax terrae]MCJ0764332.1 hypothetical protein [Variovorax terrae]